ncbi:hypothetical protein WJX74_001779 [Apatococcus lobatus]|uniref:Uncharacterized protein n=1 Tax=Apatococcus lobatus TaxID=904363 RepID=A0AAW1S0X6_9CHLO
MVQAIQRDVSSLAAGSTPLKTRRRARRQLQQTYEAQSYVTGASYVRTALSFSSGHIPVSRTTALQVSCYASICLDSRRAGLPTLSSNAHSFTTNASRLSINIQRPVHAATSFVTNASSQQMPPHGSVESPGKARPAPSSVSSLPSRNSRAAIRRREPEKSEIIPDIADASPWAEQPEQQPARSQMQGLQPARSTTDARRSGTQEQQSLTGRGRKRPFRPRTSGHNRDTAAGVLGQSALSPNTLSHALSSQQQDMRQQQVQSQEPCDFEQQGMLELGRVGKPHGVKGEISIIPLSDSSQEALTTPGTRWLTDPLAFSSGRGAKQRVVLEQGRPSNRQVKSHVLVKFEGIDSKEAADLLRGKLLLVAPADQPKLPDDDEFYASELIGMQVLLSSNSQPLGEVIDVYSGTGEHDTLKIELSGEKASFGSKGSAAAATPALHPRKVLLVPFERSIVPVVDQQQRHLVIDPPAGLLELAATPKQPKGQKTRALGNAWPSRTGPDIAPDGIDPSSDVARSGQASPSGELELAHG